VLQDLVGLEMPIGSSKGELVADIGMTVEEVKHRSTLKLKDPRVMGDGSRMGVEEAVFDYRIGNSAVRFPQSRYYWLETGKGDPHIIVLSIGIAPRKMLKPETRSVPARTAGATLGGWLDARKLPRGFRRDRPVVGWKTNRGRRALLGEGEQLC
jgi:hypothetical protein